MAQLHETISNNVAVDLFNRAAQAIKRRSFAEAHTLLDEALNFVTRPHDRMTILMAQARTPKSAFTHAAATAATELRKAGCFVYFALIPLAVTVTGLVHAIHAYLS